MGDRDKKEEKRSRTPYVKPGIERVELRPEEAVLGACKLAGVAGPAQSNCSTPLRCNSLRS
jgi:hypothetical protein